METWFTAFAFPSMVLVAWQSLSIMQNLWYGLKNVMEACGVNDALFHQGTICDCRKKACRMFVFREETVHLSVSSQWREMRINQISIHVFQHITQKFIVVNCCEALKGWAYHNQIYREPILTPRSRIISFYFSTPHIIYNDNDHVKSHRNPWNICYGVDMRTMRSKHIHNNGLNDFILARIMLHQFQFWVEACAQSMRNVVT